jgi:hypothetical protein
MNDELTAEITAQGTTLDIDFSSGVQQVESEFSNIITLKGDKGENGYSPTITEAVNTDTEYKLNITTADGSFTTPNLKAVISGVEYITTVANDSQLWEQVDDTYRVQIYRSEHNVSNIKQIIVQIIDTGSECYEDVCYSYKIYFSGKVAVIFDKKINCRIIIKGD